MRARSRLVVSGRLTGWRSLSRSSTTFRPTTRRSPPPLATVTPPERGPRCPHTSSASTNGSGRPSFSCPAHRSSRRSRLEGSPSRVSGRCGGEREPDPGRAQTSGRDETIRYPGWSSRMRSFPSACPGSTSRVPGVPIRSRSSSSILIQPAQPGLHWQWTMSGSTMAVTGRGAAVTGRPGGGAPRLSRRLRSSWRGARSRLSWAWPLPAWAG